MAEFSRAAVGVVAVLVVASAVAGAGVGGAAGTATTAASGHVDVSQSGTTLTVNVTQSAFGVDDAGNATVAVAVDGSTVANASEPSATSSGTNSYEVDLAAAGAVADRDLSSANVTVEPEGGNESTAAGLDLRYVALGGGSGGDSAAGHYDSDSGEFVLPVATSVGVPDDADVELNGSAAGESATLTATMRANASELAVSRTDGFASLALAANGPLSVSSAGGLDLDGGSYDASAGDTGVSVASVNASSVALEHPLLFDGREYTTTVTTTRNGTDVVTTRTGAAGDRSLTVEHDGAVRAGSNLTVQYGNTTTLGTATVQQTGAVTATLSPDGRNVSDTGGLAGSGETNVSVFDGGSHDRLAALAGVPYDNGTARFGEAGYELANASYVLVFEPDDGAPFTALVDDGSDNATVTAIDGGSGGSGSASSSSSSNGGDGGLVPGLGLGTVSGVPVVVVVAGGAVLVTVVALGTWLVVRDGSDGSGGRAGAGAGGTPMMDVDVRVVDELTGEPVDRSTSVVFEPTKQHSTTRSVKRTVAGEDAVSVPRTPQRVSFASDRLDQTATVSPTDPQVELAVPPRRERVAVEAAGAGTPIRGATVELSLPDGSTDEATTDADGTAAFTVPRTVDDRNCELAVDHERYHSTTTTTGLTDSVALDPQTGSVRVDARLDGEPAPDVDVVVEPDDEYTERVADGPATGTTGSDGTATVEDLPVGAYVARLDFADSDTVEASPVAVEVTADGPTTETTVDAEFAFRLDDAQRRRVDELHRDISDLTPSNRDGAVPYYFGNVLSSVLSTVDDFEDSAVAFVSHGVDPDEAADATIAAVADAVEYTRTAMTNKQNVDLFSACRGLREARVKWDGDVSVSDLVAFLGDETANHRQEMISRLEAVDAVLDEKQDEVSTVTPARDQYEQVREHATGLQDLSPAEQRAHFFVGLQLLDAVESTFEQPELVDRLEETVF